MTRAKSQAAGPESGDGSPAWSRAAGWFAIAAALFAGWYYYLSVVEIEFFSTRLPSLGPRPDGQEYFAGAISLLRDGEIAIRIGDDLLPSRYPPLFSLAIAPFAWFMSGEAIVLAPYMANRLFGILLLATVFGYFAGRRQYWSAGIGVMLMATLPAFVTWSRSSMSENLGALLVAWAVLLTVSAARNRSTRLMVLAAFCFGLAASTRLALLPFAAMLAAVFLIGEGETGSARIRGVLLTGFGLLAGLAPLLVHNWTSFGDPLRSGYDFWINSRVPVFSPGYAHDQIANWWRELTLQREGFDAARLFGTGAYVTPVFGIVTVVAAIHAMLRPTRLKIVIATGILLATLTIIFYRYVSIRLYYPQLVLAVMLVAGFCGSMLESAAVGANRTVLRRVLTSACVVAATGFMAAGYPSQTGSNKVALRAQFTDMLDMRHLGNWDRQYEPIDRLRKFVHNREAVVITQTGEVSVVLASSLLPPATRVIPEDGNHGFRFSQHWRMNNDDIDAYFLAAVRAGKPVFYAGSSDNQPEARQRLSALVPGARWQTVEQDWLVYVACLQVGPGDCNE